jgi:threonine/homoserine/homoserine lactone efflux protein
MLSSLHLGQAVGCSSRASAREALRDGMIANLTNPNALIFMLAFLPQFTDPTRAR